MRIRFGCPMRSYLHSFGRRYPHGSWCFSRSANAASTLWPKLAADDQRFGMIDRLAALIADPRVPARARRPFAFQSKFASSTERSANFAVTCNSPPIAAIRSRSVLIRMSLRLVSLETAGC